MTNEKIEHLNTIRDGIKGLMSGFGSEYWRELDATKGFPDEFVKALSADGWLSALVPEEYGGSGLGIAEASVIMEEINHCGGNAGTVHGQMYNLFTLVKHGTPAQKERYLSKLASGELRLQSMAVT